jgi:hypothetical protein
VSIAGDVSPLGLHAVVEGFRVNRTYREDEGNASPSGPRAVELRILAEPELLIARGILPAEDGGTVEQDLDGLAGGQLGRDPRVAV